MKIAVYYYLNFGGAKRVVMEQIKGLVGKGHRVDVYTINNSDDQLGPAKISSRYYNYHLVEHLQDIRVLRRLVNTYTTFVALKALNEEIAQDIDKRNYDLVLVHPDKLIQAPYLLRYLTTKSIYYCQEPPRIAYEYSHRLSGSVPPLNRFYENIVRYFIKVNDRKNVRSSDESIASCYHIRERMIEAYDVLPSVMYAGIDQRNFKPMKFKRKNEILFFGTKSSHLDGYNLLLNSLRKIPRSRRPRIKIISWKKSNKERLTDKQLVSLYNKVSIVVSLTKLETFGLIPLESMSCGTPIIATNVSGHRETIKNKKTGFLVEFDPEEIAQRIMQILSSKKTAKQMGQNGRKHILEKWTWDKKINDLEDYLYKSIQKSKG